MLCSTSTLSPALIDSLTLPAAADVLNVNVNFTSSAAVLDPYAPRVLEPLAWEDEDEDEDDEDFLDDDEDVDLGDEDDEDFFEDDDEDLDEDDEEADDE